MRCYINFFGRIAKEGAKDQKLREVYLEETYVVSLQ